MEVICLYGADAKVGVTMLVEACSAIAVGLTDQKILVLHLDGKTGTDYREQHEYSLDSIRLALISDVLTIPELLEVCVQKQNVWHLQGVNNLVEAKKYTPKHITKLLSVAQQSFDYVLVDAGSSADNGLSLGALTYSNRNILVTTQQESALRTFIQKDTQILSKLSIVFADLLINKNAFAKFLPVEIELAGKYGMDKKQPLLCPLSDYAWQAEAEKCTLLNYNEKAFVSAVRDLTYKLFSIEDKMLPKRKFSLRGRVRS